MSAPRGPARGARFVALKALESVFDRRGWVKAGLSAAGRFEALSARDKALALEISHGVVRQARTLRHLVERLAERPASRIEPRALVLAMMGLYQLWWLERVPAHAAVSETVALAGGRKRRGFVNAILRAACRHTRARHDGPPPGASRRLLVPIGAEAVLEITRPLMPDWSLDEPSALGVAFSHPDALVERWLERFGAERTRALLVAGNTAPPVFLRANRLRTDRQALAAELAQAGIEARALEGIPDALELPRGVAPGALAAVREGRASVQDPCAQQAVLALWRAALEPPVEGARERVVDLCAAPGGKACYLAELGGDRIELLAVDRDAARLERLENARARLGLTNLEVRRADAAKRLELGAAAQFDRVLLDVPCSNTGVLRRRVEARWRFEVGALERLVALQARLLENAARITRAGGVLLYSTCSLEHEENRAQIEALLSRDASWRLEGERLSFPEPGGADGGYWALLRKGSR